MERMERYPDQVKAMMLLYQEEDRQYREKAAQALIDGKQLCCRGTGLKFDTDQGWIDCPACRGESRWGDRDKLEKEIMAEAQKKLEYQASKQQITDAITNIDHGILPIEGSVGEKYFQQLGIKCNAGSDIGYRNKLPFVDDNGQDRGEFPALVCRVRSPDGKANGRYVIYLAEKDGLIRPGYRYFNGPNPADGNFISLRKIGESDTMAMSLGYKGNSVESGLAWMMQKSEYVGGLVASLTPQSGALWEPPSMVKKAIICVDHSPDKFSEMCAYTLANRLEGREIETEVENPLVHYDKEETRKRKYFSFTDMTKGY